MSNDYENLAKIILATPQGARIMEGFEKLSAFMASREGYEILSLLANGATDAVRQAAQAAIDGDGERAKTAISTLLSSKEGAALAAKLLEIMR
ncbi:MAG: hypothetical protein IJM96_01065 [Clostridia bacterium]|nr:hypothetical protein [Clostridia bacterium]